tara:strand:- start:377 stop:535 length:159 start_codon:yes stop_codon:yes gene_type:complete
MHHVRALNTGAAINAFVDPSGYGVGRGPVYDTNNSTIVGFATAGAIIIKSYK